MTKEGGKGSKLQEKKKKKKDAVASTPVDSAKRVRPEFSISPVDASLSRGTKKKGIYDDEPPAKRRRTEEERWRDEEETQGVSGGHGDSGETHEAEDVREASGHRKDIQHVEIDQLLFRPPEFPGDDGAGKALLETSLTESAAKPPDAEDDDSSLHEKAGGSPAPPQEASGPLSPVPVPPEEEYGPEEEWKEWAREAERKMEEIDKQIDSEEESSVSLSPRDDSRIKEWSIKDFITRNKDEIFAEYESSSLIPPKIDLINRWTPVKKTSEQKSREKRLIGLSCVGRPLGFLLQYGRVSYEDIDEDDHDPEKLRKLLKSRLQAAQTSPPRQRKESRRHLQRKKTIPASTRSPMPSTSAQQSPMPSTSHQQSPQPSTSPQQSPEPSTSVHNSPDLTESEEELDRSSSRLVRGQRRQSSSSDESSRGRGRNLRDLPSGDEDHR